MTTALTAPLSLNAVLISGSGLTLGGAAQWLNVSSGALLTTGGSNAISVSSLSLGTTTHIGTIANTSQTIGGLATTADLSVGMGITATGIPANTTITEYNALMKKIKDLVAQGKSLDEIKAAVGDPPPAQGKGGGRGGPAFPSFTEVVYQELTKKGA